MSEALPTNSSCSPFDSEDYVNVVIASAVSAFLSLLASSFVIFIILFFNKWKFFSQKLILYLAIAVVFASISTIIRRVDYENQRSEFYTRFCEFSGFLVQITDWMLLNAVTSITIYLFAKVVMRKETEKYNLVYAFYIFLFPFTFNWIMFINSAYGRAGSPWCWIRAEEKDTCERFSFGWWAIFVTWYVPLYVTLIILIILYVIMFIFLKKASREWIRNPTPEARKLQEKAQKDIWPLMAYPVIYILLSIFPLINRILQINGTSEPVLGLWYTGAILYQLQGGFVALAYTFDPQTRKRLRSGDILSSLKTCLKRKKSYLEEYPIEITAEQSLPAHYKFKTSYHNQRSIDDSVMIISNKNI